MVKEYVAKYNGNDVIITVGETVTCKRETGHVFFSIPIVNVRFVALVNKNELRLNWPVGKKVVNALVKSGHAAKIVTDIRQSVVDANE